MYNKSEKQQRKSYEKHCLPRISPERTPTVDLYQTVHAGHQFCQETYRQFVEYQQATAAQYHSKCCD